MNHRFEVLDIFRGLFASMVFFFHLAPFAETALIRNQFVENSDMFVDFFFVLSGFVIAYRYESIADTDALSSFFRKRFFRLYPLHLFMLLVFLGLEGLKLVVAPYVQINQLNNPHNSLSNFISSLLLLNSTPIFGAKDVSWNIPSWSISAEMVAYLVFGCVILLVNTLGQATRRAWIYGVVIALATGTLIGLTGGFELNYSFNYGFIRAIIGFFGGVLCFYFFHQFSPIFSQASFTFFSIAEALALLGILLAVGWGNFLKPIGLVYDLLFFGAIFIFAFEKGIVSAWLRKIPFLHTLGKYSYSIYMTHALVISGFNVLFIRLLHFPPSAYSYLFILNFALVYLVSAWTFKHIEMRFQALEKSRSKKTSGIVSLPKNRS
ncbi:acyltransferase family protein [Arundinibacter roseus]|uniref:Acyltransferase n=1 Tax=Arundinibacter roseus TaxID=2070510 RepID=A0A4V6P8H8_9BACT|nr:acyltransferase [Arundinibacter roseus]TDB59805.1 acyltransferase [Arundinibacter roseus]